MDLQTFTINFPKGRIKQVNKGPIGNYPLALVPGQFTDYYKVSVVFWTNYLTMLNVLKKMCQTSIAIWDAKLLKRFVYLFTGINNDHFVRILKTGRCVTVNYSVQNFFSRTPVLIWWTCPWTVWAATRPRWSQQTRKTAVPTRLARTRTPAAPIRTARAPTARERRTARYVGRIWRIPKRCRRANVSLFFLLLFIVTS